MKGTKVRPSTPTNRKRTKFFEVSVHGTLVLVVVHVVFSLTYPGSVTNILDAPHTFSKGHSDVSQDSVIVIDVKKEAPDPISVHLPMINNSLKTCVKALGRQLFGDGYRGDKMISSRIREMEVFLFRIRLCSRGLGLAKALLSF